MFLALNHPLPRIPIQGHSYIHCLIRVQNLFSDKFACNSSGN